MKNEYKIMGDYTVLYVRCKGEVFETKVDTEDLPLLSGYKWYANVNNTGMMYVKSTVGGIQLHRLVMGNPKGKLVDHIHHDTLDNRKSMLRVTTNRLNSSNRKEHKSKSGIRGVYWHEPNKMWAAQMAKKTIGYYKDKYEAGRAVTKHILEHYDSMSVIRTPIKIPS